MFARRLISPGFGKPCQYTYACPDVFELTDGDFAVIGEDITKFAGLLPLGSGCSPTERIVRIPRALLIHAKAGIPDPS